MLTNYNTDNQNIPALLKLDVKTDMYARIKQELMFSDTLRCYAVKLPIIQTWAAVEVHLRDNRDKETRKVTIYCLVEELMIIWK